MKGVISFLTDFGTRDPYVGQVKAVIHNINPEATVIDLSHGIKPFCIICGAYALYSSIEWFSPGTVFLVVVDPGVGSSRRAIIVEAGDYYFVGPDNGVFWPVIERFGLDNVLAYSIRVEKLGVRRVSSTFHGRDVFGPAAAWLSKGRHPLDIASPIDPKGLVKLSLFEKRVMGDKHCFRIIYVDRFGNMALSGGEKDFVMPQEKGLVRITRLRDNHVVEAVRTRSFSLVEPGGIVLYINSFGFLELSMNMGNLYRKHGYRIGDWVCLENQS